MYENLLSYIFAIKLHICLLAGGTYYDILAVCLKNVTRNSRAYFAYFVSSSFSIAVFFSFAVYLFHPKLQNFSMISEISGLMIFQKLSLSCSRSSFYFIQSDRF